MDLRQLQYVVAVADSLNFSRAAEECHVVQSALSHQIQRLEAELDMRLFERTSRRVRVTPAGELLVAYARRILATVAEARVELDALAGLERGELAVGATQTAGRVLDVIALFGSFHRQHSGIKLASISGPADVEIRSRVTLSGDAEALTLTWRIEASERGTLVHERASTRIFPRVSI